MTVANYTGHGWAGTSTQHLYGADLAKAIREKIKEAYPKMKFSITSQTYSGGQSIHIALMSAPFSLFATPDIAIAGLNNRVPSQKNEEVMQWWNKAIQNGHHGINYFHISTDFYLTNEGKEIMTKIAGVAQEFNFDDSDSQIDYFHTNFYLNISIGKWDKPFIIK